MTRGLDGEQYLSPDQTALRPHRRLTQINGFPNGNGRHRRLMADLLIEKLDARPLPEVWQ